MIIARFEESHADGMPHDAERALRGDIRIWNQLRLPRRARVVSAIGINRCVFYRRSRLAGRDKLLSANAITSINCSSARSNRGSPEDLSTTSFANSDAR